MPYSNLLLRPDLGKKAHRLRCRLTIDAAPRHPYMRGFWEREFEKAKYKTAEWFVEDMAKEGWTYVEKHGFTIRGPLPAIPLLGLPKASQQPRWHIPSQELLAAVRAGHPPPPLEARDDGIVYNVPSLDRTDKWEYELAAVFYRPTILQENPDALERKEEMAKL